MRLGIDRVYLAAKMLQVGGSDQSQVGGGAESMRDTEFNRDMPKI